MFNKPSLLLSKDISVDFSEAKQSSHQCPVNIFPEFISESVSYPSSLIAACGNVTCDVWTYYLRKENRNSWQPKLFLSWFSPVGGWRVCESNQWLFGGFVVVAVVVVVVVCSFKISLLFHLTRMLGNKQSFLVF